MTCMCVFFAKVSLSHSVSNEQSAYSAYTLYFWLILDNKRATIAVFPIFIILNFSSHSYYGCVIAVLQLFFFFHPLIFHNLNNLNKPLSVDTLMYLVTNACIWSQSEFQFLLQLKWIKNLILCNKCSRFQINLFVILVCFVNE